MFSSRLLLSALLRRPTTSFAVIHLATPRSAISSRPKRSHAFSSHHDTDAREHEEDEDAEMEEGSRMSHLHPNFKEYLASIQPTEQLRASLMAGERERLDVVYKQMELFLYMSPYLPSRLGDEEWRRLLFVQKNARERIGYMEFLAVKHRREEKDRLKAEKAQAEIEEYARKRKEQIALHDAGGMGYGQDAYSLVGNPLRNRRRLAHVLASRYWAALRIDDGPRVIIDMSPYFLSDHFDPNYFAISRQIGAAIGTNLDAPLPLVTTLAGLTDTTKSRNILEKQIGTFSKQYHEQSIVPDTTTRSPSKCLDGVDPKDIVYISRHAHRYIDGPVTAAAYVICASFDNRKESIICAKKAGLRTARLPLQKYVNWQQGSTAVPIPNLMRMFRELRDSGGDWKTALENNISKRHMTERDRGNEIFTKKEQEKTRQREEIIACIQDAYPDPPE